MRFRIRRVQEAGVRKAGFDGINNFSTVWDPDTDIAKNNNIFEMVKRRAARWIINSFDSRLQIVSTKYFQPCNGRH